MREAEEHSDEDKKNQIGLMNDALKKHFGVKPAGIWLAERVWEPQLAKFISKEACISKPQEFDAALLIEIAPAMEIHTLLDIALKRTKVELGMVVTERHFGLLLVHHKDQGEVREAGLAILREAGHKTALISTIRFAITIMINTPSML